MTVSLDTAVEAQLDTRTFLRLELIRFDLPGKTVGYHMGGRPFTYNGLKYLPNRYLDLGNLTTALGSEITKRTIKFSDVATSDPDDAIAALETYDYLNAPVIVSTLIGDPDTGEAIGVLISQTYEIDSVSYPISAVNDGQRTVTVQIDLEPAGRGNRDSTQVMRSSEEQTFDNLLTDTAFDRASKQITVLEEWGRR